MRSVRRAPLALLRMRRAGTHAQQPIPAVRRRAVCACAAPLPPRLHACAVPPNAAHAPYATPPRPSAAHAQSRRAPSRACALRSAAPPPRRSAQAQCPPSPPSPPPQTPTPHPGGDRGHGRSPLRGRCGAGEAGRRPSAPRLGLGLRSVPPRRSAALSPRPRPLCVGEGGGRSSPLVSVVAWRVSERRCEGALCPPGGALYGECGG